MATIVVPTDPLEAAQWRLSNYLVAEATILKEAQSYQVGDGSTARALVQARLEEVQRGIVAARLDVDRLSPASAKRRVYYLRS